MGYYMDLEQISIDDYREILTSSHLIPSWMILRENMDVNLERIKKQGVRNLQVLQKVLKNKEDIQHFSEQSGLPEKYLTVLRRMINGYHPKPNRIKDFPETAEDVVLKLKKAGIKNTRHLFDKVQTFEDRQRLSKETGVEDTEILRLTKLADLCRIRWVNHTFAYVLYETGYDTVEKMVGANPDLLYETIKQLNAERNFYRAHIGLNDMKMLVEGAKMLPLDIKYSTN